MKTNIYDAIVLGAGPYGLSVAAQLRQRGLHIAVFGKPMSLWQEHMPEGMLLRSRWWDTSFSNDDYSIEKYFQYLGRKAIDPLPSTTVIDYGLWFLKHAVGPLDETFITLIEKKIDIFSIKLANGRELKSKNVIMAPGLGYYVNRPTAFSHLHKQYVSHTYDNHGFEIFKRKRVVVVGGGQSALENAVLMSEAGIDVHLIHRNPIDWLHAPYNKNLWQKIRYPRAAISDGWDNWLLEHIPYAFQKLPRAKKDTYLKGKGKNGPAGSHWLIPRSKNITFHKELGIESVEVKNKKVLIKLFNNTSLSADHIILATGYKGEIKKLSMLNTTILKEIQTYNGYPILNSHFESSTPGLYFTGFTSHMSFGPLYRFVAGTNANAKRIAKAITRTNDKQSLAFENIITAPILRKKLRFN